MIPGTWMNALVLGAIAAFLAILLCAVVGLVVR